MVDDDVQDGGDEDILAPPGPRRSTFTPPPRDPSSLEHAARVFNDDEIAAALAAQFGGSAAAKPAKPQPAADTFSYEPPAYDAPSYDAPAYDPPAYNPSSRDQPADDAPEFVRRSYEIPEFHVPESDASESDVPEPAAPEYDAGESGAEDSGSPSSFDPPVWQAPAFEAPDATAAPDDRAEDSGWAMAPGPTTAMPAAAVDPNAYLYLGAPPPTVPPLDAPPPPGYESMVVPLPPTTPENGGIGEYSPSRPRPERQSLADEELLRSLQSAAENPGATLDVIEQLQNQLLLREEEAQAFRDWEGSMLALGTPDAIAAVEEARAGFADVVRPPAAGSAPLPPPPPASQEQVDAPLQSPPQPQSPPPLVEPPRSFLTPPEFPTAPGEVPPFDPTASLDFAARADGVPREAGEPPTTGSPLDLDAFFTPAATGETGMGHSDEAGGMSTGGAQSGAAVAVYPPTTPVAPESQPIPVAAAKAPRAFVPEETGAEPTAADQRVGRAARMFWMWFAANSSLVSIGFGAIVFSLGMSLRQSIVAVLAGVALSFIPLGLGTLAGKRSGQPTMIVSRATFGVIGNVVPALIALGSRLFWGAALLWILGAGTASILVGAQLTGGLTQQQLTLIAMAAGFLIALVIAFLGYGMIARVQLVISIISAIFIVGFIALTFSYVHIPTALTIDDGSWLLAITGAVLVFSFVGLVWANSSADLARYQSPRSSGGGSMLWATFGAGVPSFVLIAYGALLAASNSDIASGLLADPVDTLGRLLPLWYPVPLLAATALSLLSGVVISIYSAGFALQAVGLRVHRDVAAVLVGVILAAIAATLMVTGADFSTLFRDFATTLAVPVAAWSGIFASEMMIRNRRFEARSLLSRGGVYANVRWVNFIMLLVISAIGCGLISATVSWLGWQGYLFPMLGIPLSSELAATDLGVVVALGLGLLTPIVAGIPAIRRQERATPPAE